MKTFGAVILSAAFAVILSAAPLAVAQTAADKGLAIAVETDRRDSGFGDYTVDMVMVLTNRRGQESTRYFRGRILEMANDGEKRLFIFDRPRDIKGTAVLKYTRIVGTDDQWLYLPALKRVKRISAANQTGAFLGGEFAYEDIGSQEVAKFDYSWLRDAVLNDRPVFVIERRPRDTLSGYTRQVVWVDKAEYRVLKVEYYDRKDALRKTLTMSGYELYLDRFWRAGEMTMVNHQTGKSTRLVWKNFAFGTGLTGRDFTPNRMKRLR